MAQSALQPWMSRREAMAMWMKARREHAVDASEPLVPFNPLMLRKAKRRARVSFPNAGMQLSAAEKFVQALMVQPH